MIIDSEGKVGIGNPNPMWTLDVAGTVQADEVRVTQSGADFVFEDDYDLMPLAEVEEEIRAHRHQPVIPFAAEMAEDGVDVGVMQSQLLQKIEELTLYIGVGRSQGAQPANYGTCGTHKNKEAQRCLDLWSRSFEGWRR